jgi:hypothetical protein
VEHFGHVSIVGDRVVTTDRPAPWLAQFLEEFNAVQDRRPQISEQAARRNAVVHLD